MGWLPPVLTARLLAVIAAAVVALGVGLSGQSGAQQGTLPPLTPAHLDSYQRGEPFDLRARLSTADLWTRIRDLRRVAPGWVARGGKAQESKRRLAVATYALELVGLHANMVWEAPLSIYDLVEWACDLLREGDRFPAERLWDLASVALLERVNGTAETIAPAIRPLNPLQGMRPDPVIPAAALGGRPMSTPRFGTHVRHLQQRFPDEARWTLARAVVEDQYTWPQQRGAVLTPRIIEGPEARYRDAIKLPAVRQEAQVRLAYLHLRAGAFDDALAGLEAAGVPEDRVLQYWLYLFKGEAMERTKRAVDALMAYQAAFEAVPFAQSATVAFASALVTNRRPADAVLLLDRMVTVTPAPVDPWLVYIMPEYRFWPERLAQLRKEMAP